MGHWIRRVKCAERNDVLVHKIGLRREAGALIAHVGQLGLHLPWKGLIHREVVVVGDRLPVIVRVLCRDVERSRLRRDRRPGVVSARNDRCAIQLCKGASSVDARGTIPAISSQRRLSTDGIEQAVMRMVGAPSAAEDSLAVAAQVVSQREAGCEEEQPRRNAGHGNAVIDRVPRESQPSSGILRLDGSQKLVRRKLRRLPHRGSHSMLVCPGADVRQADAKRHSQLRENLPLVGHISLDRGVAKIGRDILHVLGGVPWAPHQHITDDISSAHRCRLRPGTRRNVTGRKVGKRLIDVAAIPTHEHAVAGQIAAQIGPVIASLLRIESGLDRMGLVYLGEIVGGVHSELVLKLACRGNIIPSEGGKGAVPTPHSRHLMFADMGSWVGNGSIHHIRSAHSPVRDAAVVRPWGRTCTGASPRLIPAARLCGKQLGIFILARIGEVRTCKNHLVGHRTAQRLGHIQRRSVHRSVGVECCRHGDIRPCTISRARVGNGVGPLQVVGDIEFQSVGDVQVHATVELKPIDGLHLVFGVIDFVTHRFGCARCIEHRLRNAVGFGKPLAVGGKAFIDRNGRYNSRCRDFIAVRVGAACRRNAHAADTLKRRGLCAGIRAAGRKCGRSTRYIQRRGDSGCTQVAAQHRCRLATHYCRRRNEGLEERLDLLLPIVFVSDIKEQFLVMVESSARYLHRAANAPARIKIPRLGARCSEVLRKPIVGVGPAVAQIGIERTVILGTARLADRVDQNRPSGLIGAKVRGLNLDLLHLVHVDVGDVSAHIAGIDNVCAVGIDVDHPRLRRGAVGSEVAEVAITRSHGLVVRRSIAPIGREIGESGQDGDQFRRIAAHGRKPLNLRRRNQRAVFTRTGRNAGNLSGDGHGVSNCTDAKNDLRNGQVVARMDDDSGHIPILESLIPDLDAVGGARLHGGEIEKAIAVAALGSRPLAGFVDQHDLGSRNYSPGSILDRARNGSCVLRTRKTRKQEQDHASPRQQSTESNY